MMTACMWRVHVRVRVRVRVCVRVYDLYVYLYVYAYVYMYVYVHMYMYDTCTCTCTCTCERLRVRVYVYVYVYVYVRVHVRVRVLVDIKQPHIIFKMFEKRTISKLQDFCGKFWKFEISKFLWEILKVFNIFKFSGGNFEFQNCQRHFDVLNTVENG